MSSIPDMGSAIVTWLAGFFCHHHNKIQLVGYEAANGLLVWHRARKADMAFSAFTFEALAALSFLFGSASIYVHHPQHRPADLFCGSLGLNQDGILLIAAGYPLTGMSVALASMETARGGLITLQREREHLDGSDHHWSRLTLALGQHVFAFYVVPVDGSADDLAGLATF